MSGSSTVELCLSATAHGTVNVNVTQSLFTGLAEAVRVLETLWLSVKEIMEPSFRQRVGDWRSVVQPRQRRLVDEDASPIAT